MELLFNSKELRLNLSSDFFLSKIFQKFIFNFLASLSLAYIYFLHWLENVTSMTFPLLNILRSEGNFLQGLNGCSFAYL